MMSNIAIYADLASKDDSVKAINYNSLTAVILEIEASHYLQRVCIHFGKEHIPTIEELLTKLKELPDAPKK